MSGISRLLLLVVGYAWMLAIPLPNLGRNTYIDENALQPGQVGVRIGPKYPWLIFS